MRHVLLLLFLCGLASCTVPSAPASPRQRPAPWDGWAVRGGGYVGRAEIEDVDGIAGGGRVEVTHAFGEQRIIEVGARASVGARSADDDIPIGSVTVDGEWSTIDVFAEPVLRAYLPADPVRLYLEAFVGYGYTDGDFKAQLAGTSSKQSISGGGVTYGGGGGVEFRLDRQTTLTVGAEYRVTEFDIGGIFGDVDTDDILGVILVGWRL